MMSLIKRKLLFLILLSFPVMLYPQRIEVKKIWDIAAHNAFTDLIRYKQFFYCTFREGSSHVPKDTTENGRIRILRSLDGTVWESVTLLTNSSYDLRDPKISITPEDKLMILMGGTHYEGGKLTRMLPHFSISEDGRSFHYPLPVSIDPAIKTNFDWIWRITWNGQTGYGVVYQSRMPGNINKIRLLKTPDGINWKEMKEFDISPLPNEATIRFDNNDNMIILLRREANANGMLGVSNPPYLKWTWTELEYRLGGPDFIVLNNNLLCLGTRLYKPEGTRTVVYLTDQKGNIKNKVELPSGGDTSYPGLVFYKGWLWVSYYSSHEGKTSVYLARLKVKDIPVL